MKIAQWVEAFEERVPLFLQESWDKGGKQLGCFDQELKGVVVAMDVTPRIVDLALEGGCNLIVTHHPILFSCTLPLTDEGVGNMVLRALENRIAIYASHTAFDSVRGGINDALCEKLGLSILEPLQEASEEQRPYSDGMGYVCGFSGTLRALISQIREKLGPIPLVRYGSLDHPIHRVAVLGGSGMSFSSLALKKNCEVFITGDVKYHDALDALHEGMAILDLGHYGTECWGVSTLTTWVKECASNVPVICYEHDPNELRQLDFPDAGN